MQGEGFMYALYTKRPQIRGHQYTFREKTHLFGCNLGMIPHLLELSLDSDANEPLRWHVNVEEMLANDGKPGCSLIIDLKPNQRETNLSLYEVANAWGFSAKGWTPLMLHLRGLFVDESPNEYDREDFMRLDEDITQPIFSIMYVHGTIVRGELAGKWLPPARSSTNSVLLWPDSMTYFAEEAKKVMASKD